MDPRKVVAVAGLVLASSLTPIAAFAATGPAACTDSWTDGFGGNFADPSNWSTGKVPGTSDVACINLVGSYTVSLTQSISVGALVMNASGGSQTLDITGGSTPFGASAVSHQAGITMTSASQESIIGPSMTVNLAGVDENTNFDQSDSSSFGAVGPVLIEGTLQQPRENDGTIPDTATLSAAATWTNKGTISAQQAMTFNGGGTLLNDGGTVNSSYFGLDISGPGTTLDNESGTVNPGAVVDSGSTFIQGSGKTGDTNIDGDLSLVGTATATFTLTGGAQVSGDLSVGQTIYDQGGSSQDITWDAPATVSGLVRIDSEPIPQQFDIASTSKGNTLTIAKTGSLFAFGGVSGDIVNNGTASIAGTYTSGSLINNNNYDSASLYTDPGVTITNNAYVSVGDSGVKGTWIEAPGGTTDAEVHLSGATSVLDITGTSASSFAFDNGGTIKGKISNTQSVTINSGTTDDDIVNAPQGLTNAGQLIFDPTGTYNSLLNVTGTLHNTGSITASGTRTLSPGLSSGSLSNSGTVSVGSGEAFSSGAGFTQTAKGNLALAVAGSVASSLTTAGKATLAGRLIVDTQAADATHTPLTLVTGTTVSGQFATVSSPGAAYQLTYGTGTVTAIPLAVTTLAVSDVPNHGKAPGGTINGTLDASGTPLAGEPVNLVARGSAGATVVDTATTDSAGKVSFNVSPKDTTSYYLSFIGDATYGPSTSKTVTFQVQPQITAKLSTKTVAASKVTSVVISGAVTPLIGKAVIALQIKKNGKWMSIATCRFGAKGKYSTHLPPVAVGSHSYRIHLDGTSLWLAANSPAVSLKVTAH